MPQAKTFTIEDARIIFRNFSGKTSPFNTDGDRDFCVVLTPDMAEFLAAEGWNVKVLQAKQEGDEDVPYINVRVNFANFPPRVVMITDTARTALTEQSVGTLDWADIIKVDLKCRGHEWEVNGKTGIKAYLKSLFITVDEDELERKYAINTEEGQAHSG